MVETIDAPQGTIGERAYPPEPWALAGDAVVSVFALAEGRLPATPEGFSPLTLAGRGLVTAGWVSYGAGSVLEYSELFAAVAGTFHGRPTATVTHMWVDSEASRAGGRELWGYPKEMADFELDLAPGGTAIAWAGGAEIARGTFSAKRILPRLPQSAGGTVQVVAGETRFIRAANGGRPALGRASFTANPDGPLGFLAGAKRLGSVGLHDFRATFGEDAG